MHPFAAFIRDLDADPQRPVITRGETTYRAVDLQRRAGGLATDLAARGITPDRSPEENRVLIHQPNAPDMAALILAVWAQGGLPMLLSAKAPPAHLEAVTKAHRPRAVYSGALPDTDEAALPLRSPAADADASVVFTSGSTGTPKGVVQTGATLTGGVARTAAAQGYGAAERILVPIPFAHDYGWGQLLSGLAGGHHLILPEADNLVAVSRAITAHAPSVLAGVPSLYAGLLFGISDFENSLTDSLRILTSTGSHFPDTVHAALTARMPHARIMRNYGLTETYRSAVHAHGEDGARAIAGVRLLTIGPDGGPLPPDTEGEIVHIGAGVFDRYLDAPEATARCRITIDGAPAVRTGDIGRIDAEGRLTLLGRRDRLIKSMDIRVNLTEVETALMALDPVAEAATLPRAHPVQGTEIAAYVVAAPGMVQRDIQRAANRTLPAHMRPRHWHLLDALPRTPVGKIDYQALGAMT